MFASIERVPGDAILGLIELFNQDNNPNKIDLGVGVYRDSQGYTPILQSVREAEALLLTRETTKAYIGSHGAADFAQHMLPMILGEQSPVLAQKRASLTQSPGGTGALRIAHDFISRCLGTDRQVWVSNPTWPNHHAIIKAAGLSATQYRYVDAHNQLDFSGMLEDLQQAQAGDVVLLHACCHNPTGFDLSQAQWQQLLELIRERQLLPLLDFAYQGFGDGLAEDAYAVRLFAEQLPEVLITASCSKNFGLYRERVGAFVAIAADANQMETIRSQIAVVARANYSNPPAHGSAIVSTILGSQELSTLWHDEVSQMRQRISNLRHAVVDALKPHGLDQQFTCFTEQRGMFSYSGLTPEQVKRLQEEFGIYMVSTGRMNMAGLTEHNLSYFSQALATVCR